MLIVLGKHEHETQCLNEMIVFIVSKNISSQALKQTPVTYLQALLDHASTGHRPLGEESVHIVQFPVT